jgi:hypothetical protein
VRRVDFLTRHGAGLLAIFRSHLDLLRDCWPEVDWGSGRREAHLGVARPVADRRMKPQLSPLSIKQILRWADD